METVLTIGHSSRTLDEFVRLLRVHEVAELADVRTVPRSRKNPQFNLDSLPAALRIAGIAHVHMPGLGGLRRAKTDSINTGWENANFRGYADYMQTAEFEAELAVLLQTAVRRRVCIMCAEAVPWRCHRSLIADALTARQVLVEHILSASRRHPHRLTRFARVENGRVTYPLSQVDASAVLGGDLQSE